MSLAIYVCVSGLWLDGLLHLSFSLKSSVLCTCISMHMSLAIYACLSGLWLGGLLHLSFYFLKKLHVAAMHMFPCIYIMSLSTHPDGVLALQGDVHHG